MTTDRPSALLYLLSVGREKELALQVHDQVPNDDELANWMRDGTIARLQVSSHGEPQKFTLVVNFTHVVAARLAPYGAARSASF
jgi:hypothetical protein